MVCIDKNFDEPNLKRYASILAHHALGACFNPYRAFLSLQTCVSLLFISNHYGCSMYTSSSMIPFRNVVFSYIWWIFHPIVVTRETKDLRVVYLVVGEKASS